MKVGLSTEDIYLIMRCLLRGAEQENSQRCWELNEYLSDVLRRRRAA